MAQKVIDVVGTSKESFAKIQRIRDLGIDFTFGTHPANYLNVLVTLTPHFGSASNATLSFGTLQTSLNSPREPHPFLFGDRRPAANVYDERVFRETGRWQRQLLGEELDQQIFLANRRAQSRSVRSKCDRNKHRKSRIH